MNKTISINPDLFKFSNNRKSKKKDLSKSDIGDIKIRDPKQEKQKQKHIRKQHVLRFIRDQQERNYQKLLEGDSNIRGSKKSDTDANSDFDESMKYLMTLSETNTSPTKDNHNHNYTVKQPFSSANHNNDIKMDIEPIIHMDNLDDNLSNNMVSILPPKPSWGCLKNGSLPTYRNWKNYTQKAPINQHISTANQPMFEKPTISANEKTLNPDKLNEIRSMIEDSKIPCKPVNRYLNQKRTVRRTYKLGKSKSKPTISVLISNKTIRNNIMTKSQLIKQIPIDEIKRYLVKNGFIRVGTCAPNDVLRKMYETASLMCGEINNHNPDNLLYNYMNNSSE